MASADDKGNGSQTIGAEDNGYNIHIAWGIICIFLGLVGAIFGILKYPNEFKLVVLGLVALFWILFEFNNSLKTTILSLIWNRVQQRQGVPDDSQKKAQIPAVRWGLGALLLLFLLGWGYGKLTEPPTIAGAIDYMIVLDTSDAMKEPFDITQPNGSQFGRRFRNFMIAPIQIIIMDWC